MVVAVRIARALGTTVDYLVTGEGPAVQAKKDPDVDQVLALLEGLNHDQLIELRGAMKLFINSNLRRPPQSAAA